MKVPVSFLFLPEPYLPAERKKRAAKRKIQEEAEAARSAAGAHSAESAVAASNSSDRLDHVFAVPKTPSPVPAPAAAATEESAAARPRRKAGLRPQKREMIAAAPSAAEPEVGHSKQLLFG